MVQYGTSKTNIGVPYGMVPYAKANDAKQFIMY